MPLIGAAWSRAPESSDDALRAKVRPDRAGSPCRAGAAALAIGVRRGRFPIPGPRPVAPGDSSGTARPPMPANIDRRPERRCCQRHDGSVGPTIHARHLHDAGPLPQRTAKTSRGCAKTAQVLPLMPRLHDLRRPRPNDRGDAAADRTALLAGTLLNRVDELMLRPCADLKGAIAAAFLIARQLLLQSCLRSGPRL